ncbi:Yip1 domain protein [Ichthyophthirius multifiliis]|uniref:Yip1 domain protein n=1 Tax=Ichthyophthirius multifiliis TaxID=5932 RepID=G0QU63_ICHMU|nr:Yip1 domain protein [Ichthyophthirius multifiliis]EGR31244.1 Yip1 domain protein [Ichthyophthirius multifiliis]|eukprot:XP_004034730.1 Yip1 domain protein [Ichthyophthirius multifiliis]
MEEGEHLQRELNEQDDLDNLDLQYDKQNEIFDHEKFTSELLFAVQGLGSNKFVNQIEIYVKGDHCEENVQFLEIFYFVFACFDPEWFLDDSGKDKEFLRLLNKDRNWKKKIQGSIPVRHSRFYQNFSYQRLFGDTRKILDNPFVGQGGLQGKKWKLTLPKNNYNSLFRENF